MLDDPFTLALHADDHLAELPDVAPPIRPSTTFERGGADVYRRNSHETVRRLEAVIGSLEGGEAVVYPFGMGAIGALLRHLRPARIALPSELYHGVIELVAAEEEKGLIERTKPEGLREGDVHWVKTPSNPSCLITDVAPAAAGARASGAVTIVDATFATPVLQHTLGLGADYVMQSTTKAISGHADASGGVIVTGDPDVAGALRAGRTREGLVPGAFETWLTLRGMRTLPLRIQRQSETALAVARHLSGRVPRVLYPGLESHPGHDVAVRQMKAYGAVVSFDLEDQMAAARVVSALRVFRHATSLGGVESLAEQRLSSDPHAPPGLIRLSIGLEDPGALTADLSRALEAAAG